ncbi:hypothetical protein ACUSIJ_25100 [Pseudochelatococcus sp. B33]
MRQIEHHRVTYTAKSISLGDVINVLSAHQKLLHEGALIVSRSKPGLNLTIESIKVETIYTGSLHVDLLLELYKEYQTDIEDIIVGSVEGVAKMSVPDEYKALVTIGTLIVVYFVARRAYEAVFKKREPASVAPQPVHIEGEYNRVVNLVAHTLNVTPEVVEGAVSKEITEKKQRQLLGRVSDFLRPAKREPGSEIQIDGVGVIGSEVVAEYPTDADLASLEDMTTLDMHDAEVEIRATDRDNSKSGWKAKILNDKNFSSRLPMVLSPDIDIDRLADLKTIKGDLKIEFSHEKNGVFKPKRIHLLRFDDPA